MSTTVTSLPPIELFLDSRNSQALGDEYINDNLYTLPRPILAQIGSMPYLSLISLTIPHSFLIVNSNSDQLYVNGTIFNLTPGNYSAAQLILALDKLIPFLDFHFNTINLKVVVTGTTFSLDGSMLELLGVRAGAYQVKAESTYTLDLSGVNSIYVMSNFVGNNIDTRSSSNDAHVLARVPVNSQPLGIVQYVDLSSSGILLQTDSITSIRLILEDEHRRPLAASIFYQATLQIKWYSAPSLYMSIDRPTSLQGAWSARRENSPENASVSRGCTVLIPAAATF